MECIIQVFPDEYHLQTLETLLAASPQLQVSDCFVVLLSKHGLITPVNLGFWAGGLISMHLEHLVFLFTFQW